MTPTTTTYLGLDAARLSEGGGLFTAQEIVQQPAVWQRVQAQMAQDGGQIQGFLAPWLARRDLRIVLTGAGSSASIGQCLAPLLHERTGRRVEAIATTDLVSAPAQYFQAGVPTLLVSFARSGSSPESVAAVELADACVHEVAHLIVTCNGEGPLLKAGRRLPDARVLLLPPETHDRGFAMTSSFTSMLWATACAFGVVDPGVGAARAAHAAQELMHRVLPLVQELVRWRLQRVVYLGSNALKAIAQEAALKLMELSDGRVVAVHESPLGFRHGPKTIVDEHTLVVVFLSSDPHVRRYETDLLAELRRDGRAKRVLALSAGPVEPAGDLGDDLVRIDGLADASVLELAMSCTVFAQVFAFLQSLALRLTPDQPNAAGTVNRVVSGVTIYPYPDPGPHAGRRPGAGTA